MHFGIGRDCLRGAHGPGGCSVAVREEGRNRALRSYCFRGFGAQCWLPDRPEHGIGFCNLLASAGVGHEVGRRIHHRLHPLLSFSHFFVPFFFLVYYSGITH